jgi:hypothetical protein
MASFNLAPICNNWQSFLDSGAINNGGWIYTYLAGTSSPLPTYTSSTGSIANPSQIQLLANGRPPNPIWLPSGFAYKFIIYDHLLNQVGITEDNIVGVGDTGFAVTSAALRSIPAQTALLSPAIKPAYSCLVGVYWLMSPQG